MQTNLCEKNNVFEMKICETYKKKHTVEIYIYIFILHYI